jgi:hypothetical protein
MFEVGDMVRDGSNNDEGVVGVLEDVSSSWGRRLIDELVAHCGSLKAQDGVLCNLQLVRLAHHLKAKRFRPRLQKLGHCRQHKPLHPQLNKQLQAHQ